MATSTNISISLDNNGLWNISQDDEVASKVSELLQRDLQEHHVFLNSEAFHDHMPHHLLALYGTGASAANLVKAFDQRHPLQRKTLTEHAIVQSELFHSWDNASKYLGKEEYYPDFLVYFQRIIESRGYESVTNEYLFEYSDAANDLLVRLHAGVLHPLIQLMYGLEWKQPAIVAQALAETCIHGTEQLEELLLESEALAQTSVKIEKPQMFLEAYQRLQTDPAFTNAVRFEDKYKILDGIMQRAKEPLLPILRQIQVSPEELKERTMEMFHDIIYVASGAAIHPPNHVKYDFFLMHHINSALIYLTINDQQWISEKTKVRMLEWKMRMDLIQYLARGCPDFSVEKILSYLPKEKTEITVRDIGTNLHSLGDDGHAIKQARAVSVCHEGMKMYEDKSWAILKGDHIWEQIQYMVIDAVQGPGRLYVRGAGWEEAWKDVPDQSEPKRSPEVLQDIILGQ